MKVTSSLILVFAGLAHGAAAQPFLPRCGPGLDGQVSQTGCICQHEGASQLSGREAGWRWYCDLLRGSAPPPAAIEPPPNTIPGRPPGVVYTPKSTGWQGY